jgi:2-dehydropantoate 2-reductase
VRYIIYGAGAIGGVIAACLFQHGHDVIAIARGAHLEAMRARGLTLRTPDEAVALPVPVAAHPSEIDFRPDDVVLLTMKTQDTERALEALRAAAGDGIAVVCAQNAVENERLSLRRFARTYGMLVILPGTHLEPGVVLAHSAPTIGILDAGRAPAGVDGTVAQVTADLTASGFSAEPRADIMRWKYAKLLSNLGNAIQAACGFEADTRDLAAQARDEATACYRAAGIDWASDGEMRTRRGDRMQLRPIDGARRFGGSSWQSIARGAGSIESDYLNGEIVLLGRLHGVATPMNAALQRIGEAMVRDGRAAGSVAPDELRRAAAGERATA